ncbi:MAG TPA: zinc-binding alcohol dehydrogenase family protein, partial [Chthoniobacterales bacterium]|nr:zinc-binding alcohol dehydrogenase family protein [Chthoniobacterales bacterium]
MKALYFRDTGSLANLRVEDIEVPRIDAHGNEALVRVRAAAINPSDPKSVLGKISETTVPRVPGRDFAGIVVEGPATWKGKEIFGTGGDLGFGRNGSHAEFVSVPVEALVEKPVQLSFEQGAALGLGYLTAWSALVTAGRVSPNDIVLVLGATGAVGSAAVKVAKHIGAKRVVGVLRKEADRTRTAGVPSDDWLVLEKEPLPQGLFEITQGKGADVILDAVGGSSFESVNQCLAHRGRHVVIASIEPRVSFNLLDFYHREARLIGVDTLKLSFSESAAVLREIVPLVNAGVLTPPQLETIAIEQGPRAYRA